MSTRFETEDLKRLAAKIHEAYDEAYQQLAARGRGPISAALNQSYELVHQALLDQRGKITQYLRDISVDYIPPFDGDLQDIAAVIESEAEEAPDPEPMPDS